MTTPTPYVIYGYIYDWEGNPQTGATVQIIDQTDNQGTAQTTSTDGGYYQIEVSNYVTDGDTIQVSAAYGANSTSETFVLDISDAVKQQNVTIPNTVSKSYTLDAHLKATQTKTYNLNTWLQSIGVSTTFDLNGHLKAIQSKSYALNALLRATQSKDFTLNSHLKSIVSKDFDLNALLSTLQSKSFNLNSRLLKVGTALTMALNAHIKQISSKTFYLNSHLKSLQTLQFALNAYLKAAPTTYAKSFALNAVLYAIHKSYIEEVLPDVTTTTYMPTVSFIEEVAPDTAVTEITMPATALIQESTPSTSYKGYI